ncbi:MAG TPA: CBS domain-containing protein [Methanospirillum sp.]|uniref:magnesium transporter MgtE N-terminal domain-containing protein n=1 Tax=Methanospirillum sp. TaxID=45200 RepID=UPI002C84DB06|nr:CBS domain-containing protein [Methanospirillum sp.]HWQ64256.1 CBS domain-containing protein [Methanospirillum sp.]
MIEGDLFARPINVSIYYTELLSKKVTTNGKRIGRIRDLLIIETLRCPEVTHFVVQRAGKKPLFVPWEKIISIHNSTIEIAPESSNAFELEPESDKIPLQQFILNKKVIDLEDHEIRLVNDINLIINMFNKLLVFEVDFSKMGYLRRYRLRWLAEFIQGGRDEERTLVPWTDIQLLPPATGEEKRRFNIKSLKDKLSRMHPVDIAEIIEDMDQEQRAVVFSELDTSTASDALEEIAPPIQREIVSVLSREKAVAVIDEMTPGQAADILEGIPFTDARDILDTMTPDRAKKVRSILEKSEENILDYTTTRFIMLPPEAEVGKVRDEYAHLARDKDVIMYLYIVDDSDILRGIVDIKELLQAEDDAALIDIMVYEMITLTTESTLKDAAEEFTRYDFRALPVIDPDGKIIGVVPYRDIMKLRHHPVE